MSDRVDLGKYKTVVFDCDGVILNSNHIKTEAFRRAATAYGEDAAEALVQYHVANGGVSRYKKFDHFLEYIVESDGKGLDRDQLLARFAEEVKAGLMKCEQAPGLTELRSQHPKQTWMVVSGGDQEELREVFEKRGIASYFDGGIFGSPRTKEAILQQQLKCGELLFPAVFLGDSQYDLVASHSIGIDFIFIAGWSEVKCLSAFLASNRVPFVPAVSFLI